MAFLEVVEDASYCLQYTVGKLYAIDIRYTEEGLVMKVIQRYTREMKRVDYVIEKKVIPCGMSYNPRVSEIMEWQAKMQRIYG